MGKGSNFERQVCKELGLWWTNGERDDVFWRSSNSGGRATVRGRQGKKTYGQAGDVAAVDPIGEPLLKFVTIEIKRGYSSQSFAALLDRPKNAAQQTWEAWIQQAIASQELAGSFSWMIISKRDQRDRIMMMPQEAWEEILLENPAMKKITPFLVLRARIRLKGMPVDAKQTRQCTVVAMKWEGILHCEPSVIRKIVKSMP